MKRFILPLLMLFCISMPSLAQSTMTDDQVLAYVKEEHDKGTDQKKIVTELLKKGVSTAQLQRVRAKALKMQSDMKNGEKKAVKEAITSNSADTRAKEIGADTETTTAGDATDVVADDVPEIEMDEEEQRKIFGRDIFSSSNLTFQPSSNMATPRNYTLGPGDQITVNVWGSSQQSFDVSVSADGYVVLPNIGQIKLAGLTVSQAKATLKSKLGAKYGGSSVDMSVTDIRTIQVQVMGEVKKPGTYSISGLSSAFNALYTAGGISDIGTLRDICVFRSGRKIATIDVYDYILNGNAKCNVHLADNDVIVVGAYDCLVKVTGNVKRPMWYEMKKTETAKDVIRFCGGFNGNAYTKSIRVLRKNGVEYSIHTIDEFQMGAFQMADEDLVEVDSIRARFSNIVELKGAAKHPGKFELGGSIQTVKELLMAADGLSEDAYEERAIIHREKPDLTLEMVSVDIKGILDGTASDVPLKNNDVLFIPSKTDMLGERIFTISGEVVYPGTYPYSDNTTLRDVILEAGGLKESASLSKIDVYRRLNDQKTLRENSTMAETYTFAIDESFNIIGDTAFFLKPYDKIVIRRSPGYTTPQDVFTYGEFNFPGRYAIDKKQYRLSDLVKASGGFTPTADLKNAMLTRKMNRKELEQLHKENIQSQIDMVTDGLKNGRDFNGSLADSLLMLKRQRSTSYIVAIDIEKAVNNPGSNYDIILRANDILDVPEHSNVVSLSGEVMQPVAMTYEPGKNLYYYINHAGGFSDKAKRTKIYGISMSGAVTKLHANSVRDIEPGMTIVVPQKGTRKRMSTAEMVTIGTSIISMGAIITSLINIIKK